MDNHCTFSLLVGTAALATEEVSYLAELPPPAKIEKVLVQVIQPMYYCFQVHRINCWDWRDLIWKNAGNCFLQHSNLYQP